MQVLEKVAKAVSRNYGVTVIFSGQQAFTDGTRIVLPTLPDNLAENDEVKVRGYCDHEIGHVRYTDMKLYKEFAKTGANQADVLNLVEDLWIEKKQGADYPGAKVNMERTAKILHGQTVAKKGFEKANEHILAKVWVEGRRQNCGMRFADPDMTADIKKVFGDDFFERLAEVDCTEKAIELAKHMIKKADEPKGEGESEHGPDKSEIGDGIESDWEPMSEQMDNENDDDGEDEGCCGGEGEGENEGDGEDDGEGDGADGFDEDDKLRDGKGGGGDTDPDDIGGDDVADIPENAEKISESGEGDIASEKAIEGDDELEKSNTDHYEVKANFEGFEDELSKLKDELEQKHRDALKDGEYLVLDTSKDLIIKVEDYVSRGSWTDDIATYNKLKCELGPLNTIKSRIVNLFNTRVASKWMYDREMGKINSRALAKVKHGCRNVFKEKWVSRETDTAISFLVDFSGSMGGKRLKAAMQAVIMFLETLQATKIKSEVLGYTTGVDLPCRYGSYNYGRVEQLITYVIKEFGEPFNGRIKKRISNYEKLYLKENCDPENVKIAYERLKARPEKRKLLFVLSDGAVANLGNTGIGMRYYKKLVKQIEREGVVEPIGIGFMSDAICKYYKKCIGVNEGGTVLAKSLFEQLRKVFKV